jgi:hypothetical protein
MRQLFFIKVFLSTVFVLINIASATNSTHKGFAPIDVVYHGSPNRNITTFEPRVEQVRDKNEGALIFATPSIQRASCYLFRWDDSWVNQSVDWNNDNKADFQFNMVISDDKRFKKLDKGGAIYLLPVKSFTYDEQKGLGIYEWTSRDKVKPFTKLDFPSALEAMKNFGVKIYFLNKGEFKTYKALSGEEQVKFLSKFKAY